MIDIHDGFPDTDLQAREVESFRTCGLLTCRTQARGLRHLSAKLQLIEVLAALTLDCGLQRSLLLSNPVDRGPAHANA